MFYLIGWQNTWGHDCRHCMGTRSSGAGAHRTFFLLRRTTAHCQDPTCFSWVAERVVGSEQVGLLANSFVDDDDLVCFEWLEIKQSRIMTFYVLSVQTLLADGIFGTKRTFTGPSQTQYSLGSQPLGGFCWVYKYPVISCGICIVNRRYIDYF